MIVFENCGEIDPRLISLIGVNVKESDSAIGYFGTGLKYSIACLARWGEELVIQSGKVEFRFAAEESIIRGKSFNILIMRGEMDELRLGFTTDLGKNWEPWMVYRELWCNAHDEVGAKVYEAGRHPPPTAGVTRIIVSGAQIEAVHKVKEQFILHSKTPLCVVDGLEIHPGENDRIFYRGIAVQKLEKPSKYTYNITERLYLTEDRTCGSWQTDPIVARGLAASSDYNIVDTTLTAPTTAYESRLDYDYVRNPGDAWKSRAEYFVNSRPRDVPASVRDKFIPREIKVCPTCHRAM